jgi:hypothetical protein
VAPTALTAPIPLPPGEEATDPRMLAQYRKATPEAKLAVVARLNAGLIALKVAQLERDRADLTEAERRAELRRWWLGT